MKNELLGKTALITGSTSGIGLAIAKAMLERNANVILHGRHEEKLTKAQSELKLIFPQAQIDIFKHDFAQVNAPIILDMQYIDILINNLGIFDSKEFCDIATQDWSDFWNINVMSGVNLCKQLIPYLTEKNWGRIIFISSQCARTVPEDMIHYAATKASQIAVAKGLAKQLKGKSITVNSILAGPTQTEGFTHFFQSEAQRTGVSISDLIHQYTKEQLPDSIIQRLIQPEEIAELICYLCSKSASFITGASIKAEGGLINDTF
ncbi:SDR family oxidoreductase [Acinetobacter pittii]|uniref:SDR family NAD(P)-dependent oxidoreductase n=1 Tax=Acinetobacter pittii TaxID=48296 RepID=UPI00197E414A|nr:SDR family oxidoreductase [Acinetobacter pittii]MBN6523292.1 SDR family oxidoreductase [Acinetobacter pittii]